MGIFFFAPGLGGREGGGGNAAPSRGEGESGAAHAPAGTVAAASNPLPVLLRNSLRLRELEPFARAIKELLKELGYERNNQPAALYAGRGKAQVQKCQ